MTDEPIAIIVPAALARSYHAARTQGRRAAAIDEIMSDRDVWNEVCKDCCAVMESHKDIAEAVQFALVQVLDLRCPCKPDLIRHQPRELTCDEILDGKCGRCGAKIEVEEVKP